MNYKIDIDLKDIFSMYNYSKLEELPKDVLVELLLRQINRIKKASDYIEENDNSELGINQTEFISKNELLDILSGKNDNKD